MLFLLGLHLFRGSPESNGDTKMSTTGDSKVLQKAEVNVEQQIINKNTQKTDPCAGKSCITGGTSNKDNANSTTSDSIQTDVNATGVDLLNNNSTTATNFTVKPDQEINEATVKSEQNTENTTSTDNQSLDDNKQTDGTSNTSLTIMEPLGNNTNDDLGNTTLPDQNNTTQTGEAKAVFDEPTYGWKRNSIKLSMLVKKGRKRKK